MQSPRERRPTIAVDLRALVPERPTGIGVYTLALLERLARRGAARYVGMAHARVPCAARLEAAGVELEVLPAPLGLVWQQLRLPWRLRRGDVDLFWSPLNTLPLALPVPGVVSVMDLTAITLPETHTWKVRLSTVPFLRRSLARAARIVAISEATAADVARYLPAARARLSVVPCGVEPDFRPAAPEEVRATRAELGCPDGYVLYAGTLEPRKNVARLVDAWERLRRERAGTPPLLMTGAPGWRNEELRARVDALAPLGLRHLGFLERAELVRVFQAARVFCYPSLYEGFGLPAAEALACGVPTIVSDVSSLPEVVGDAGLQVPPHDADALHDALRRVLADDELASELARRGPARAARFDWDRAAEALERVLLEALSG